MSKIPFSRISKTVYTCTKGRLALTLMLTLVALFATVGVLAKDYSGLTGGNAASEPTSFMTSLSSLPSLVTTRFFPQKASRAKASISTAKKGYVPGEAVTFRGEGFRPGETVSLRITHLDGTSETSDTHKWQSITVGEDGTFTASISMTADSFGHDFVVTAHGEWSGASASAIYSQVALIETSKSSYDPGETAALVGSYFANKEPVTIQVTDSEGNKLREPLVAYADEAGRIAASWLVSSDESVSSPVLVTAKGDLSGLTAEATLPTPATINPVSLPNVTCPSNLNSCTANDVVTTVVAVGIRNGDICASLTDTIQLEITTKYSTTANQRYDLGLFVSGDGGTVKEPSSALVCSGAAAQVGQGDNNAYPDADTDLFLNLDPTGHSATPSTPDTCGDLSSAGGPVNLTVDATVGCNIVNNTLRIPSCRVWEHNANHQTSCQTLQQAGTGSKCDCTDLVVTAELNPCATKVCNDDDVCTNDSCVVSGTQGSLVGTCVFTPANAGTTCRASAGDCDAADTCDGINAGCADAKQSSSFTCRASTGQCDAAESCTGTSNTCPADGFASATTTCVGTSNGGACDGTDSCDGANHCVDGYQSATTTCRPSAGQCDVAESCTGSSGACPADGFQPSTTTCVGTSNGGPCDGTDSCDGSGACVDGYKSSTTTCRESAGQCDVAESCTGSSGTCPADGFQASTTACVGTSNGGACDGTDSCSGTANTCVDGFLASTSICRTSAGQCDVAESCSGTSGACPDDGFAAATTACVGTSNGGACDGTDSCSGTANTCVDGFLASTTTCRASAGQCDVAESCSGTSGACPDDGFAAATTACVGTSNGDACDGTDSCSGTANTCVDGFQSATTTCRPSAGQCDVAESCTGSSGACPGDAFQPSTTTCVGAHNGDGCDATDSCDGAGNCVDVFDDKPTVTLALSLECDDQGGTEVTQLVATPDPAGTYSFSWTGPDGLPILDENQQPITGNAITPTIPGVYTVVATDTGTSCYSTDVPFKLCFTAGPLPNQAASAAPMQQKQATASFTVKATPQRTGFRAYLARVFSLFG